MSERALQARAAAARELIRAELGLSYVIWPTLELEEASASEPHRWSDEQKARAVEVVVDGGLSWSQARRDVAE